MGTVPCSTERDGAREWHGVATDAGAREHVVVCRRPSNGVHVVAKSRTLQTLTQEDLQRHLAWRVQGCVLGEEDATLCPVALTSDGAVPAENGVVWCLAKATFANGAVHSAAVSVWPSGAEGPELPVVWNGARNVPILVPPAPDFVLAADGPHAFASAFGLAVTAVFPITLEVVPEFVVAPRKRAAVYAAGGRLTAPD